MKHRSVIPALAVLPVVAALAACGGGGKGGSATTAAGTTNAPAAATAASQAASGQDDCQMLAAVNYDLGSFDATGTGFDYVADKNFIDGYAGRAPGGIAQSVQRIRDLVDRIAKAEQDAGVSAQQDPSEAQLQKIKDEVHYSTDEQAQNAQALSQLAIYAGTSC